MDTIWLRPFRAGPAIAVLRLGPQFGGVAKAAVLGIADVLLTWQERARQRRALASMDDHILRDIGLSRADIHIETSKPFWRV